MSRCHAFTVLDSNSKDKTGVSLSVTLEKGELLNGVVQAPYG